MADNAYDNRDVPRLFKEGDCIVIKEAQDYDKIKGVQDGMTGAIVEVFPLHEPVPYRVSLDNLSHPLFKAGFLMYQEQIERI